MSTRANIILKDGKEQLFFYRHSDGYPEGALPTLYLFLDWVKKNKIRDNLSQSAGWLIILGALEYQTIPENDKAYPTDWKVGSIEPTTGIHGDIEWLYTVDLVKKEIQYNHV